MYINIDIIPEDASSCPQALCGCRVPGNSGRRAARLSRKVLLGVPRSLLPFSLGYMHAGGCQNYGPFLGPHYNTAPMIHGTQRGTLIFTTTHVYSKMVFCFGRKAPIAFSSFAFTVYGLSGWLSRKAGLVADLWA